MFELRNGKQYTGVHSEPSNWEIELTEYFGDQFSQIINTGVSADWPRYTVDNPGQLSIRNDELKVILTVEDGTKIQRSQKSIDHYVTISQGETTTDETTKSTSPTVTPRNEF